MFRNGCIHFISFAFYRAHETEKVQKNRLANDNATQKTKYASLSPNSKRLRNQKRTENRRLKRKEKFQMWKKMWIPKLTILVMCGKLLSNLSWWKCDYEKLRERNIQERNNLLEKLKIDKLKEALKVKPVSNNLK